MKETYVELSIAAPMQKVYTVFADCQQYCKAVPHITKVELLSGSGAGVGTRFKETRLMRGRETSAVIEVTESIPNQRLRFVSDEGGAVWDTVFTFAEQGSDTRVALSMTAKPYKLLAKLVVPLVSGAVRKAVEGDMAAVKAYCESQA